MGGEGLGKVVVVYAHKQPLQMMMWWHGMISEEPNYFDVAGEGYMVHRMWRKGGPESSEWGDWYSIREMSYNFGWKGYKEYHS